MAKAARNQAIDSFLRLSQVLTGEDRLERDLAGQYYGRIREAFGNEAVGNLLSTFDRLDKKGADLWAKVGSRIMGDKKLGPVAKEIIMLWYMSGFRIQDKAGKDKELGPETPDQYFRGLFWPTIRAHPLGLSGGYFGYWKYPPEN